MTTVESEFHHRVIGLIVVGIGAAEWYGLHPLLAPIGLILLGLYGWTFPFEGPEDATHRLFSSLAIAGGLFEWWRRTGHQRWMLVSQSILLLAALFLLAHRHAHHQTLFVTIHHTVFAVLLVVLAWRYPQERLRAATVILAGMILMIYFID